jgi:hypothetical protein
VFDRLGNLWMVTDISSSALNVPTSPYAYHRNNGIFMIRTGVPDGASLEVGPARASEPFPGLVVVPFPGHGFPRPDFVGEAELHLVDGKVARVVFRAP